MSDIDPAALAAAASLPEARIVLTLSLDPATGALTVSGQLANELVCYGMLEMAKDVVRKFATKQKGEQQVATSPIHLPFGPPPGR